MVGLAQSALKTFGTSEVFIENVLTQTLDSNRLDVSMLDALERWLKTTQIHSNTWERVFIYFVKDAVYRKNLQHFSLKLIAERHDSNHWHFILKILSKDNPSEAVIEAARRWTRTQSKNNPNWQDAMLTVLESRFSNQQDLELAKKAIQYADHYGGESSFLKLIGYVNHKT